VRLLATALSEKRCSANRYAAVAAAALASFFSLSGVGLATGSTIRSSDGAFATVIPHGFANKTAAYSGSAVRVDLLVVGPVANRVAVTINVVRERDKTANATAIAQASMAFERASTRDHAFSTPQSLSVAGDAAEAYDYLTVLNGKTLRQRQAYVVNDGWAYVVTYTALSGSQYQGSFSALGQMLAGWRWL
jgi:hypothetical protein